MKRMWRLVCSAIVVTGMTTACLSLALGLSDKAYLREKGEVVLLGGVSLILAMCYSFVTASVLRMSDDETRSLLSGMENPAQFNWLLRSKHPVRFWVFVLQLTGLAILGVISTVYAILRICLT